MCEQFFSAVLRMCRPLSVSCVDDKYARKSTHIIAMYFNAEREMNFHNRFDREKKPYKRLYSLRSRRTR